MSFYDENAYEQCLIELFRETLGWDYCYGPDVERDFRDPLYEPLSDRRNIIVIADEAHRGQYGLTEKIKTTKDDQGNLIAHRVKGTARIIRDSLPHASFIGFTGTPISRDDRNTTEVFGNYIDIYDMTQAVEDGATRPVYYESRVVKLKLVKSFRCLTRNSLKTSPR